MNFNYERKGINGNEYTIEEYPEISVREICDYSFEKWKRTLEFKDMSYSYHYSMNEKLSENVVKNFVKAVEEIESKGEIYQEVKDNFSINNSDQEDYKRNSVKYMISFMM